MRAAAAAGTAQTPLSLTTLCASEIVHRLVHDFATHGDATERADYSPVGDRPRYSITLNGRVRVEEGELAERYRQIHLGRNAAYSQFIVGDDIAIITVRLNRARVCDVNDRVQHFRRDDSGKCWSEFSPAAAPSSA